MLDIEQYQTKGLRSIDPASKGLDLAIRYARQEDFLAIDTLQKSENDKLGFMPESAIRKRIEQHNVLVAEVTPGSQAETCADDADGPAPHPGPLPGGEGVRQACFAGYCLGVDRYQKRSELGIIYQMAVAPEYRRSNVAAALLQAQFDESAYGTKLYCCWCKQSLAANRFWEAMGFVPLAFRAGARPRNKKQAERPTVHVFWQKRIRTGDTQTPWWYPYETQGGAMMEGRVVLPLPPEMDWNEAVPVVLPGAEKREQEQRVLAEKVEEIAEQEKAVKKGLRKAGKPNAKTPTPGTSGGRQDAKKKQGKTSGGTSGGASGGRAVMGYGFGLASGFGVPIEQASAPSEQAPTVNEEELARLKAEKEAAKQALKAAQRKNDPELVAYARELRDRWQEHVAPGSNLAGMIEDRQRGKYEVGRLMSGSSFASNESKEIAGDIVLENRRLDAA